MKLAVTALLVLITTASQAAGPGPGSPFLKQHCMDCHDAETKKGGLDLGTLSADLSKAEIMAKWIQIHDRIAKGEMPPKKKPQPAPQERATFVGELAKSLTSWDMTSKGTVMRRLNRAEYEQTLRDLLGVRSELQALLPEDGKAFGFDNVGEALDLSAVHLQRYMDAAGLALREAIDRGPAPEKEIVTAPFERGLHGESGMDRFKQADGSVAIFGSGIHPLALISPEYGAPADGMYRLKISGNACQSSEPVTFLVAAGGGGKRAELHSIGIFQLPPSRTTIETEVYLRAGERLRVLPRFNVTRADFHKAGLANYKGPGVALMPFEIEGPFISEWPGKGHRLLFGDLEVKPAGGGGGKKAKGSGGGAKKREANASSARYEIVSQNPAADAQRLLGGFVPAAFRRPVTDEKIAPYLKLAHDELADGSSFEEAMLAAYTAVLCAPDFLYLKEPAGKLDDFALASRLSYMLWGTAPDAELRARAAKGELSSPAILRAQTERLLNDARAARFTTSFTGQWLALREIDFTSPDKQLYPEYDDTLKVAMLKETELFFSEIVRGNLSVLNFLDSDWTMLNARLAELYGIEGVKGLEFRKVALKPEHHRGGVLTQASVLKVSANGTVTSPVVRGAWVLDRLMGTPPPPPPPGVPGLEPDIRGATTLRQQLDKHRTLETCQSCHRIIDPPGFALENYDVMGGWRENYRSLDEKFPAPKNLPSNGKYGPWRIGPPVDSAGSTPGGQPFRNLADYKKLLLAQPDLFTRALTEKLAVYASGRGMGFSDRAELDRIAGTVAARGHGLRDLIHEIVQSEIFRNK